MIRQDFVSNSSSTSFMIVGESYGIDILLEKAKAMFDEPTKDEWDLIWSYLETLDSDLRYHRGLYEYGDECFCIGLYYEDMKSDETRDQFENRVRDLLKKHGLDAGKIYAMQDQGES